MAKDTEKKLQWQEIDTTKLNPKQAKLYAEKQAAYKISQQKAEAFEASIVEDVPPPEGMIWKHSYRFGKYSIALDVAPSGEPKASKKAIALSALKS